MRTDELAAIPIHLPSKSLLDLRRKMHGKVFKRLKNPERFGDMLKERMLKSFNSLPQVKFVKHCMKSVQIRSFSWSIFSCIWTEYGDLRSSSPCSVRIRENTDQKNSVFGHFSRSVRLQKKYPMLKKSSLTSNLFKNYFKTLKETCRESGAKFK